MKLTVTSFIIALKHSSRRLLCLFCVFLACVLMLGSVFVFAPPEQSSYKARIALLNQDTHPMSDLLVGMVASIKEFDFLEVKIVNEEPEALDLQEYTAVLTIPDGFLQSVLDGGNLPPQIELNAGAPLEAILVSQMADAAARYLTAAQRGIYMVQDETDYGSGMKKSAYNDMILEINLQYMKAFNLRRDALEPQTISVSGGLTFPEYYGSALICVVFLAYMFLYQPAIQALRQFSAVQQSRRSRWQIFGGCFAHIFLCNFLLIGLVGCGIHLSGIRKLDFLQSAAALALFSFLISGWAMLLGLLFSSPAASAAGGILLAIGMGVFSGAVIPLALMPPFFGKIAPFLPLWQCRALLAAALGETQSFIMPMIMGVALLGLGMVFWKSSGKRSR